MASTTLIALAKLVISLALIVKGADWFTEAAVRIARASRIPPVMIGATIVCLTTTLPELTVSAYSAATSRGDLAVGNAIGSTVCNIGLILGSCLLIRPMRIDRIPLTMQQGVFMIGSGVLAVLLGVDSALSRIDSLFLLLGLCGYVYYSMRTAGWERDKASMAVGGDAAVPGLVTVRREVLFFLLGAGCVILGSRWLVSSAELFARKLGVPDLLIGATLVAVGTSFPEYVTTLTATIKGYQEISIGTIMGANILDILWVLGVSSLIGPLPIQRQTRVLDFPFMLLLMVLLTAFARTDRRISRREGFVLLFAYSAYVALMILYFRF